MIFFHETSTCYHSMLSFICMGKLNKNMVMSQRKLSTVNKKFKYKGAAAGKITFENITDFSSLAQTFLFGNISALIEHPFPQSLGISVFDSY